jgi:hypothetical protein
VPRSAADCIGPAFEHTKQQLFKPFRWGQWVRLAVVGLLAGELSSGGGCNSGFNIPAQPTHRGNQLLAPHFPTIDPAKLAPYIGLIAIGAVLAFVLLIVLIYCNSIFRFILLDAVVQKHCAIRQAWRRWRKAGWQFFLWQIVYQIALMMVMVILVGIPVGLALIMGWLREPKEHVLPLVLGGLFVFFVFLFVLLTALVVHVLAKDFVAPIIGLEEMDFADAWSRLFGLMRPEKGDYAIYLLLKLALSIAAVVLFGIVTVILVLIFAVPMGIAVAAVILLAKSAGLTWNFATIAAAVVAGLIAFFCLLFLISLVSVPAVVFFPAYSIYFFAARYPRLQAWLHAPPVPLPIAPAALEPPPLPPSPEPIG